jgi:hypothetical protein
MNHPACVRPMQMALFLLFCAVQALIARGTSAEKPDLQRSLKA